MIYILKNPDYPLALIGTPKLIAEVRRQIRVTGAITLKRQAPEPWELWNGLPPWARNLSVLCMFDGDLADAGRLCETFWPETYEYLYEGQFATPPVPDEGAGMFGMSHHWIMDSTRFRQWLDANARPWDGSESQALGVKGLGRAKKAETPCKVVDLRGRLARCRVSS